MNRRGFLRLAGLAAVAPAFQRAQAGAAGAGGWRCVLDGGLRWSLTGPGGALVSAAEVVIETAGQPPVPLGALAGVRRFRGGSRQRPAHAVVGRAGDLEVTVQCAEGGAPRLDVAVRGLGDPRQLVAVRFVDQARTAANAAWLGGRRSQDACRVSALPARDGAVGHWQFALLGPGSLAAAFGETGGGAGEFTVEGRAWSARARFARRAVGADERPAETSLTLLPDPDPFGALGAEIAGRLPAPPPPLWGWRSGPGFGAAVTEADLLEALERLRRSRPAEGAVVLLDDGYQRSPGDWDVNERFPHGHRWLTARIREAGFEPALWLAPFLATRRSGIPATHPEWLLPGDGAPVAFDGPAHWGGPALVLDAARRDVQDWLRLMARHAVEEWGYAGLALDHLQAGAAAGHAGRASAPHETLRAGLRALRAGAGRAAIIGARVPLQPALGLLDHVVIGDETARTGAEVAESAEALAARAPLRRRAWQNGPVALSLGEPLSLDEARAWASCVAVSGSVTLAGDRPGTLDEERAAIAARTVPAITLAGGPPSVPRPGAGRPWQWLTGDGRDWWTLALVNWDDEPHRQSVDLAAAGLRGPLAVYDVWAGERRPNVSGVVSLVVAARSGVVLGLRRPRPFPFVLGSSRHVVQGAADIAEERWDAGRRVLRGRSGRLDGRPYVLTLAVPATMHPVRCAAGPGCSVAHVHARQGAVRLEITGAGDGVEWEVGF